MKVVPLYCPNCGAPVGKDAKFCSQCGSPIVIDDGTQRTEHIHREIDEARLREAEMQFEIEKQKTQQKRQQLIFQLLFVGIFLAFVVYMFAAEM